MTDSGQFRNEKRLKDGTVIGMRDSHWPLQLPQFNWIVLRLKGTEAWIDALGYMRHKQYIADKDGYRILKSKTIYVGKTPIKVDIVHQDRSSPKVSPKIKIFLFLSIYRTSSRMDVSIRNSTVHQQHRWRQFQMQSTIQITVMDEKKCPKYWCITIPNQSTADTHKINIFRHHRQLHHQSQHIDHIRYTRHHRLQQLHQS